jgi:16S rRNA (uracil1498-N3)-methyltransferase
MDRFYLAPGEWGEMRLTGEEAHHCLRVMRKGVGDALVVFDGEGRWAEGVIDAVDGGEVWVRLSKEGRAEVPRPRVGVCVAVPKGKNMELIVQKAVELGVAHIQPLVTERTVVRLGGKDLARKREKWQRVALEACKQCGQNVLPEVRELREFSGWLAGRDEKVPGLMGSLGDGARGFREVLGEFDGIPAAVEVLIGPEGDFTAAESAAALEAGFQPVTLGTIVLRVETAALYCVGALRFWWGE